MQQLLQAILQRKSLKTLLSLRWPEELCPEVDGILLGLSQKYLATNAEPETDSGLPQYHAVLYAWRMHRQDVRGAAGIVYNYVQYLQHERTNATAYDLEDVSLQNAYLVLINTLAICGDQEAWLLSERRDTHQAQIRPNGFVKRVISGSKQSNEAGPGDENGHAKRSVITLDDIRREYVQELDRRSEIAQGRFGIIGEEMDLF